MKQSSNDSFSCQWAAARISEFAECHPCGEIAFKLVAHPPISALTSMNDASSTTPSTSKGPVNRHALTAVEKQRSQLEKLLKDPLKPAYITAPPKEKTLRPAREMMKNVQGSSAGAGSGEFHVYKASRRREYERLKLLEDEVTKVRSASRFIFQIQIYLYRRLRKQSLNANDA